MSGLSSGRWLLSVVFECKGYCLILAPIVVFLEIQGAIVVQEDAGNDNRCRCRSNLGWLVGNDKADGTNHNNASNDAVLMRLRKEESFDAAGSDIYSD